MNDFLALGADGLGTPALVAVRRFLHIWGDLSARVKWIVKISESSAGLCLNGNNIMFRSWFLNQMSRGQTELCTPVPAWDSP